MVRKLVEPLSRNSDPTLNPGVIGLIIGIGAATVGMSPLAFGLRPWHFMVVAAFILVVSARGVESLGRVRVTSFDIAFVSFIAVSAVIEYINAHQLNYEPGLISVFTDTFYVVTYLAARLTVNDMVSCAAFLRGFVWPAVPVAVIGLLQVSEVAFVMDVTMDLAPSDAVVNRLERSDTVRAWGLTGHWTGFGGYLTCVIAAHMCVMLIEHQLNNRVRKRHILTLTVLFAGVVSTLTFSVLISSLAIIVFSWRRLKLGLNGVVAVGSILVVALVALTPFLENRVEQQFDPAVSARELPPWLPSTVAYRLMIWEYETLPALFERPVLGWGSGVYDRNTTGRIYPTQLDWLSAESQWLSMAIGYGIVVTAVFALVVMFIGMNAFSAWKFGDRYLEPFLLLWVCLLATSFTVAIFTNRGAPAAIYAILGCIVAIQQSRVGQKSLMGQ